MSRRAAALCLILVAGVAALSVVLLRSGMDELRLSLSPARRDLPAEELGAARGRLAVFGCVRHDLAVAVTPAGQVIRLSASHPVRDPDSPNSSGEPDRIFTPLSSAADCNEDRPPARLYALIEDDDSLGQTITHEYAAEVAPPPVAAMVVGVVGFGAGHRHQAELVESFVAHTPSGATIRGTPLLVKGKQPSPLWVAAVTTLAGVHGFLFCLLTLGWMLRRHRRHRAIASGTIDEHEEAFFQSETLD